MRVKLFKLRGSNSQIRVALCAIDCRHFTGYVLTAIPHGVVTQALIQQCFLQIAEALSAEGIETIQEKIFASREARAHLVEARRAAFQAKNIPTDHPFTFLEGGSLFKADFSGYQLCGVSARTSAAGSSPQGAAAAKHGQVKKNESKQSFSVRTVRGRGDIAGRLLEAPGFRLLHLANIRGLQSDGTPVPAVSPQAKKMFQNAKSMLSRQGFKFPHVARSWIYLARLEDWHGELNRIRKDFYSRAGIGVGLEREWPPADAILQGAGADEECCMDVLAVDVQDPKLASVKPILPTSRMAQPGESRAPRAVSLDIEGAKTLFISSTTNLEAPGKRVRYNLAEAQCMDALLNVASMLESEGGSLAEIASSILWCKNREVYETFTNLVRLLRLPAFPTIPLIGEPSRPDLLVELEVIALVGGGQGHGKPQKGIRQLK